MSYRTSQLSFKANTRVKFTVQNPAVQNAWSGRPDNFHNVQFLRSWFEYDSLEYDSAAEESGKHRGINWNAVLGLLLVIGASAGLWTGMGWFFSHFGK